MPATHTIFSGVDLPFEPSCGSLLLCDALYGELPPDADARFLALTPPSHAALDWSALHARGRLLLASDHPARTAEDPSPYRAQLADALRAALDAAQPDILHLNHLAFGFATTLASLPTTTPALALCHGTGLLAANQNPKHLNDLNGIIERVQVVVFPTEAMRRLATSLVGALPCESLIIPWGLTAWPEQLTARQPPRQPLRALYAGRATANKHITLLLDALARTDPAQITATICCPTEAHPALRAHAEALGVSHRVTWGPFLPQRALWALFDEVDALVLPTRTVEAFGLTALEAQARGLPVISASGSGLDEALGGASLPFPAGDAEALAGALDHLARSPDVWLGLRERGRAWAKNYTLARTRDTLLAASRRIASRHI